MRLGFLLLGAGMVLCFDTVPQPASAAEPGGVAAATSWTDLYGDPLPAHAIMRLGTTRLHHHAFVAAAAFPSGGRLLASAAGNLDTAIALWQLPSGQLLRRLTARSQDKHPPWTSALAFSHDGKKLLTSDVRGNVHLWDVDSGEELWTIEAHPKSFETTVAFSADGQWVASGGTDGVVRVWSAQSGHEILSFDLLPTPVQLPGGAFAGPIPGSIGALAFSPDGNRLAAGLAQRPFNLRTGKIRVWNLQTNQPVCAIDESNGELQSLAFTADGKHLISGGNANIPREKFGKPYRALTVRVIRLHVWDAGSGNLVRQLAPPEAEAGLVHPDEEAGYGAIALSADGRTLVAGCDGKVLVWDFPSATIHHSIDVPHWAGNRGLAISADGQIVCAPRENSLGLWSTATGEPLMPKAESHTSFVTGIAHVQDGGSIVTSGDATVRSWDADSGRQRWAKRFNGRWGVNQMAVSPNGALVAAACDMDDGEGGVRILRAATGEELHFIPMFEKRFHVRVVRKLVFSPDGALLAIARDRPKVSNTYDVDLYDLERGEKLQDIAAGLFAHVHAMAVSPDGALLYTVGHEAAVCVWDTSSGAKRRQFTAFKPPPQSADGKPSRPGVAGAVFSPDLKSIITSQGHELVVWDVASGEATAAISNDGSEHGGEIAISRDGRWLAMTDMNYVLDPGTHAIRILDIERGRRIATLDGGTCRPSSFAFSPDGTRLVTGMGDGTALVWDLKTAVKRNANE